MKRLKLLPLLCGVALISGFWAGGASAQNEDQKAQVQAAYQEYRTLLYVAKFADKCDFIDPIAAEAARLATDNIANNLVRIGAIKRDTIDEKAAQFEGRVAKMDCEDAMQNRELRQATEFARFKSEQYLAVWNKYIDIGKAHIDAGGAASDFDCGEYIPWSDIVRANKTVAKASGRLAAREGGAQFQAKAKASADVLRSTCQTDPAAVLNSEYAPMLQVALQDPEG